MGAPIDDLGELVRGPEGGWQISEGLDALLEAESNGMCDASTKQSGSSLEAAAVLADWAGFAGLEESPAEELGESVNQLDLKNFPWAGEEAADTSAARGSAEGVDLTVEGPRIAGNGASAAPRRLRLRLRLSPKKPGDAASPLVAKRRRRESEGSEDGYADDEYFSGSQSDGSSDTESDLEDAVQAAPESDAVPKPAKRTRTERGVSFCPQAKTHDGLCRVNEILDLLVWEYFSTGALRTEAHVASVVGDDIALYPEVLGKFDDLDSRATCSMSDVPVLPGGGGTSAKISAMHLPNLRALRELVVKTYEASSSASAARELAEDDGVLVDVLGEGSDDCGVFYDL